MGFREYLGEASKPKEMTDKQMSSVVEDNDVFKLLNTQETIAKKMGNAVYNMIHKQWTMFDKEVSKLGKKKKFNSKKIEMLENHMRANILWHVRDKIKLIDEK
jgi:hypothetical protein